MKESISVEQNQQTVQRLSPRQVQFVRLLEMSGPEIEEEIRHQLDDNPALTIGEGEDPDAQEETKADTHIDAVNNDPEDEPDDYIADLPSGRADTALTPQIAQDSPELSDYLMSQLGEIDLPEEQRQIAAYIIGNIDENGWMTRTLSAMRDDIEIATGINFSMEQMREAFGRVRSLDPPGVGAVDLRDCMLLQLNRMKPMTLTIREAKEIVGDYFDLLSKMHYDKIQNQIGIRDRKEMEAALSLIRSLNPKPGSSIAPRQSAVRINHITPDVGVEISDEGRATVTLLSDMPRLQIENSFMIDSQPVRKNDNARIEAMQREAQAFVRLKRDDAEAFINALNLRSQTLISVTEAIVRLQPEFFATGDKSKLRPMILKDISRLTGLDISVISRATAGKYISTNTGTYPMKMFFNEAPKENSDTSSHQIMHAIKEVINGEDKKHPLSDDAICEALKAQGFEVARRTVTKYRERLGLPVGRLRKSL